MNNISIAVDGSKQFTKKFVSCAKEMGREVTKINPLRLNKEIASLYFPKDFNSEEIAFRNIQDFTRREGAHYAYIRKHLGKFTQEGTNGVAILVNVSNDTLDELKDDFGTYCVKLTGSPDFELNGSRYDFSVLSDDVDGERFKDDVERLIRVLSK